MIHPLSDCKSKYIGNNTNIWQFCVIFPNARIGDYCNICANSLIENDVVIGDNVTIKSDVQLWDGLTIEDNVASVQMQHLRTICIRVQKNSSWKLKRTIIKKRATVGANAMILCGIMIGENAMIGAGSVVTKDVGARELWYGNPARCIGKVDGEYNCRVKSSFYHTYTISALPSGAAA